MRKLQHGDGVGEHVPTPDKDQLIADLLAALERCVKHFEGSVAALTEWGVGREIIRESRAAIAKAKGEA